MCKDDESHLLNCAAGLSDGAVLSPLMFFSSNVSVDALTVLIKADDSVLRTVDIEYATFKWVPASEEYQASIAYFLQLPIFYLSSPSPYPRFPLQVVFSSPPTSSGAAL